MLTSGTTPSELFVCSIFGCIEGKRIGSIAGRLNAGTGCHRNGLPRADIERNEIRYGVISVFLELKLYAFVYGFRLNPNLFMRDLQTKHFIFINTDEILVGMVVKRGYRYIDSNFQSIQFYLACDINAVEVRWK